VRWKATRDAELDNGCTIEELLRSVLERTMPNPLKRKRDECVLHQSADYGSLLQAMKRFVDTLPLTDPEAYASKGGAQKDEAELERYRERYAEYSRFMTCERLQGHRITSFFGRTMMLTFLQTHTHETARGLRGVVVPVLGEDRFRQMLCQLAAECTAEDPAVADDLERRLLAAAAEGQGGQGPAPSPESFLASESGLGFLLRDSGGKAEEDLGIIWFECISNDGSRENLMKLVHLKNIFSRQLPKMPREYIVRLVFDRKHFSYCLKKKDKIIGGICFRPFFEQRFAEIAFLAITSTEQVKGYGTRLMNHLKEYVKTMGTGIDYFLTFADNFAIGYFQKQGFTKTVSLPKDRHSGYIKEYDGGTLMECRISSLVNYRKIGDMIKLQKNWLFEQIMLHKSKTSFEGIQYFVTNPGVPLHPSDIPGVVNAGWKDNPAKRQKTAADHQSLEEQFTAILKALVNHPKSWPFRKPVTLAEAPDYYQVITHPTDLSTMQKKVKNHEFPDKATFGAELKLMFDNCRLYNSAETVYCKCADELYSFIWEKYEAIVE